MNTCKHKKTLRLLPRFNRACRQILQGSERFVVVSPFSLVVAVSLFASIHPRLELLRPCPGYCSNFEDRSIKELIQGLGTRIAFKGSGLGLDNILSSS